jgi:hypothetical protein
MQGEHEAMASLTYEEKTPCVWATCRNLQVFPREWWHDVA